MSEPTVSEPTVPEPAVARPSATVMIIRDGIPGLEIFMVTRDRQVDFAAGAAVFPGGKVDADDARAGWPAPPGAPDASYWIAAVRETFEETGLLLARNRETFGTVDPTEAARIDAEHRTPLLDGTRPFSEILTAAGLVPALDLMTPFAHWVTPEASPKRFDTHFFLVAALPGQIARHDGREAVASFWITPAELLAEARAGRHTLVPATEFNLELLAESGTVADAVATARARRIVTVMPTMRRVPEGMHLTFPADAGYRRTEMVMKR
jgi:8-oxo-dGTP pyrophosphatase MutT (NUDIX family)